MGFAYRGSIMDDRGYLTTEHRNTQSMRLDELGVLDAFDLVNREDATVASAVAAARDSICLAVDAVVEALRKGGRLIYVGAGTSGRLGVLDATECPPTFLSDPSMVQGVIAGGAEALTCSVEGAEDREEGGAAAMDERGVGVTDVVFGIATGGTTPYVHGALERGRQRGAKTIFLACVPSEQVSDSADISIRVITGPEVLTGSTRMKAGTATKMVLNMITTLSMVRLGKVYQNLMVDVCTQANAKLVDRGIRIVQSVTQLSRGDAGSLLKQSGGSVKIALVMHACRVDRDRAQRMLADVNGRVRGVIDG